MTEKGTLIRALLDFLYQCPDIPAKSPITVDCMPMESNAFSVASRSGSPIVKQYTDGSSLRQYPFGIWYKGARGTIEEGVIASGKCETISAWLEAQSRQGVLPELPVGMTAITIEASSTGKLYSLGPAEYVYEVPCRLQYLQEA